MTFGLFFFFLLEVGCWGWTLARAGGRALLRDLSTMPWLPPENPHPIAICRWDLPKVKGLSMLKQALGHAQGYGIFAMSKSMKVCSCTGDEKYESIYVVKAFVSPSTRLYSRYFSFLCSSPTVCVCVCAHPRNSKHPSRIPHVRSLCKPLRCVLLVSRAAAERTPHLAGHMQGRLFAFPVFSFPSRSYDDFKKRWRREALMFGIEHGILHRGYPVVDPAGGWFALHSGFCAVTVLSLDIGSIFDRGSWFSFFSFSSYKVPYET